MVTSSQQFRLSPVEALEENEEGDGKAGRGMNVFPAAV